MPEKLTIEMVSQVPDQVNAACRALKEIVVASIDEAARRINEDVRTGLLFPQEQVSEKDDKTTDNIAA